MSVRHRWRRRFASAFLVAGIAGIAVWAWSVGHEAIYEDWSNWSFDRQAARKSASWKDYVQDRWHKATGSQPAPEESTGTAPSNPEPPYPLDNALIGRLSIPRLNVRAVVREGTEAGILSVALGHVAGTALPGQVGNVAVAGHRDTLFRGLRNVRVGDRIEFETQDKGRFLYEVENTSIVSPTQVSVLTAGLHPELTLVTCYPFNYVGSAPYRFIVKARQLGVDDKAPQRVLAATTKPPPTRQVLSKPLHRTIGMKPMPYSSALVYRR